MPHNQTPVLRFLFFVCLFVCLFPVSLYDPFLCFPSPPQHSTINRGWRRLRSTSDTEFLLLPCSSLHSLHSAPNKDPHQQQQRGKFKAKKKNTHTHQPTIDPKIQCVCVSECAARDKCVFFLNLRCIAQMLACCAVCPSACAHLCV